MRSIKAYDREIELWFTRIKNGEIRLPRFQRFEAWDKQRITSLLNTVIHNLPLGVTLILEVNTEPFISRPIETAPEPSQARVIEHLLDGQQRLTAIWRALHNNYPHEKYFMYFREYDKVWAKGEEADEEEMEIGVKVYCQTRWKKADGRVMPLWADSPSECFSRGCIPFDLLKPEDNSSKVDQWLSEALDQSKPQVGDHDFGSQLEAFLVFKKQISDRILAFRSIVKNYNLPFLSLPAETPKEIALNVFINMNTNSKPLTQYDIIVAEIEGVKDTSLHDLQHSLNAQYPSVGKYFDLSYLILYTSALIQDKLPNSRGIFDMDKKVVVDNWGIMVSGLSRMANFLRSQRIYDGQRLPTNAVLAVIAALYTHIPEKGDSAGQASLLLKKYLWLSFFTDRYENSASTRAYADYLALKGILTGALKEGGNSPYSENDVPIFDREKFPIAPPESLLSVGWPKQENIRGRGILAVANYFGAIDFADHSPLSPDNISNRQYHHIFPEALLEEVSSPDLPDKIVSSLALNCALITDTANYKIGRKEPLNYLKDRFKWTDESVVRQRLESHLIPIKELSVGDYEVLTGAEKARKVKNDYDKFLKKRATLIYSAVSKLVQGVEISATEIMQSVADENIE